MKMPDPILSLTNIESYYGDAQALHRVSLDLNEGETLALIGSNGAGKTTLLRMLGTIISPTSGHCWIGETRTDEARDDIRKDIGFLSGKTRRWRQRCNAGFTEKIDTTLIYSLFFLRCL